MRAGVVLVAHGTYAWQLVEAAQAVVGPLSVATVQVEPGADREEIRRRVVEAAGRQERGAGVVLLVDICGSTPCLACLELQAARPGTAVVTGLSLAMLMKLATANPALPALELAVELHRSAQRSVQLGSELLDKGARCGC